MSEKPATILLVDDESDLREGLADALEGEGYTVAQAANGREAMDYLQRSPPPALIFLDLLMPVMNGWQFCEAKRHEPTLAAIPVVAISSAASSDPTSPYFIETSGSIPKPVTLEALVEKLREFAPDVKPERR